MRASRTRTRAGYRVGRRIKPGFYYKRIQIPRTHTRAPVARETAERREKDRDKDIKNCPRENPVNPPAV